MAVLLDDGRSVGFDLKDYNQVDHGYAATIHKAQGMTVDRVHVLATPGLDAHATYVALSRHRDRVELHYGRDDFADQGRLVSTLSRERGKDMASDYRRAPEPAQAPPARNPFAGLRLSRAAQPAPQATSFDRAVERGAPPVVRPDWSQAPELPTAITRHARIVSAIRFSWSVGDMASPDQRAELFASRAALDQIQPHGAADLENAFVADLGLIDQAANGRTQAVIRAMQLEAEMRTDPNLRADTFVQRWQALDRQRRLLLRDHEERRASKVAQSMASMAKGLERDPQLESILRNRKQQLGLPPVPERSVGQTLVDMLGLGRSRGPSIGM